jgi:hypothetical protein
MSRTTASNTAPFYDDASRRQWESSIGIIHTTPKASKNFIEPTRLYTNPLNDKVQAHRPISPLLNLDEDRTNIDEYADVAGNFFSDVMTTKVPSRTGKRPAVKNKIHSKTENKSQLVVSVDFLFICIHTYSHYYF